MTIKKLIKTASGAFCALALLAPVSAHADMLTTTPTRGLEEALAQGNGASLYGKPAASGFSLSSNFFSGRASGIDPVGDDLLNDPAIGDLHFDRPAELVGDQNMYAVLVDGRYDFDYDMGSGLPVHPYLSGGAGMAMYGAGMPGAGAMAMQDGDMVPLFRLGGGVTYRLGEAWNLSLDYKAGFTGGSDQFFTAGNQQAVDMQTINMGMHFAF